MRPKGLTTGSVPPVVVTTKMPASLDATSSSITTQSTRSSLSEGTLTRSSQRGRFLVKSQRNCATLARITTQSPQTSSMSVPHVPVARKCSSSQVSPEKKPADSSTLLPRTSRSVTFTSAKRLSWCQVARTCSKGSLST